MPLYQYRCRECGYELETRQKFSDDPLETCPNCGAETGLFRVVQPTGIVFKGSGFYVTDSQGNRESVNGAPKKSADDTSGKSESKSETSTETA